MRIYDISLTITPDLPVWPDDPPIQLEKIQNIDEGDPVNVTHMHMSAHVGTHVDAPKHFLNDSSETVENLPLEVLLGRAYVLQLDDDIHLINRAVLENAAIPPRIKRLLIKTRNSNFWDQGRGEFQTDFTAISGDGAQYMVERGIKLLGVDYLSVAPFENSITTHKILLSKGIVILEGLDLSQVPQGRYNLICLPIKIGGADGAPARAVLVGV